jgi:hypothetical protein
MRMNSFAIQVKVKLSPCSEHHAVEAYWGVEVQIHSFFDLGTRCGQLHAPADLPPGKEPLLPIG